MYNPVKTIKTNTVGTVNMLGLAKRVNARILIASTSEIYGDPEVNFFLVTVCKLDFKSMGRIQIHDNQSRKYFI